MISGRQYESPKLRNNTKNWTVIILVAVLAHIAFFVLFKPRYLEIFKTESSGYEGESSLYLPNEPFSYVPMPEEPDNLKVTISAQENEVTREEVNILDELGEPSADLVPLTRRKEGGSAGKAGRRKSTVEPKPLYIPWPKYPEGVRGTAEGKVELLLYVNKNGEVENVKVYKRLQQEVLNKTAIGAARKIRFTPGLEKGIPTAMWVRLTIGFQPR